MERRGGQTRGRSRKFIPKRTAKCSLNSVCVLYRAERLSLANGETDQLDVAFVLVLVRSSGEVRRLLPSSGLEGKTQS